MSGHCGNLSCQEAACICDCKVCQTAKSRDAAVNHPAHYTSHPSGVECISIVEHMTFSTGNAVKYCWRAGLKTEQGQDKLDANVQDLKKARWYLDREIARLEKETKT